MVSNTMAPPIPPEASKEIELVKSLVARHFPVYDVRVNYDVIQFFCSVDKSNLEESFDRLREEMSAQGYIPMITYDKGEHIVTVARKPVAAYRSIYVNLALLIATFLTMLFAGVLDWASYADEEDAIFTLNNLAAGLITFTLPLIAILSVHELAHYFAARRRKVAASLPFFIPAFPPLGTFGAFISLRDPIPNRKVLLEIGVAGPLAGMLVAIPLGVLGLSLTNSEAKLAPVNVSDNVVVLWFPFIYDFLESLVPIQGDYVLHPTAFAAWVGFLVTALNLLPMGQLDGGHVARALLGRKAKYLSWATVAILIVLGLMYWGWLLFALLILMIGARHPPPLDDISKLDAKRIGVGVLAFAVLILAFAPIPMMQLEADHSFELVPQGSTNATITLGDWVTFSLLVNNTGNTLNEIHLSKSSSPFDWTVAFKRPAQDESNYSETFTVTLNSSETAVLDVIIMSSIAQPPSTENVSVVILGAALNSTQERTVTYNFTIEANLTASASSLRYDLVYPDPASEIRGLAAKDVSMLTVSRARRTA